jgi:hypothetical protein
MTGRYHILHDTDRDGWGSAALLVAALGPDRAVLRPCTKKDLRSAFTALDLDEHDQLFVLDLPAPEDWSSLRHPPCGVTWVDHHLSAWVPPHPSWVRAVLPAHTKPTTTMRVLVEAGLVSLPRALHFVSALCRRSPTSDWGQVFDALRTGDRYIEGLAKFIALGPHGESVPARLQFLITEAQGVDALVTIVLDSTRMTRSGRVVRFDLHDAHRIPLSRYSLEAERRFPNAIRVLVYRRTRLYVGRSSRGQDIDLLAHFRARGLEPQGHPYVCCVAIPSKCIDAEVDALAEATS